MRTFNDRLYRGLKGRQGINFLTNMIVFPNAKINLGLRILRKRQDGYHDLESVFYPLRFCDVLEILPSGTSLDDKNCEIYVSGQQAPATGDNFCCRASRIFREQRGTQAVKMYLHKRIPAGSGLGGGSSDAAFTLLALNEMFGCGLQPEQLKQMASGVGADCPFFIENQASLVTGTGNIIRPFPLKLKGYFLLLVLPELRVSTSTAYELVEPRDEGPPLEELLKSGPAAWKGRVINRFEEPVFGKFPELGQIRDMMYDCGALYASMSGSGSAVYGIFPARPALSPGLAEYRTRIEELY